MDTPLLWHIPLSHYSEKVRWALDYKGIAHRRRVLGPDYLIRAWRATGQGKLPVLWLDGRAIADSTRIIAALKEHHPEPRLYPRDTATRQRALALEDDLDETLGIKIGHVRFWHKRTCRHAQPMSAFGGKADMPRTLALSAIL